MKQGPTNAAPLVVGGGVFGDIEYGADWLTNVVCLCPSPVVARPFGGAFAGLRFGWFGMLL